jgi:hypothetical protein
MKHKGSSPSRQEKVIEIYPGPIESSSLITYFLVTGYRISLMQFSAIFLSVKATPGSYLLIGCGCLLKTPSLQIIFLLFRCYVETASLNSLGIRPYYPVIYKYYVSGYYPSSCFYLKHRPVYTLKHNVSETGFCVLLQVKPTQLGPIDRAIP